MLVKIIVMAAYIALIFVSLAIVAVNGLALEESPRYTIQIKPGETKPPAPDRSVYARRVVAVQNVSSDVYQVFVGPSTFNELKSAVVVLNTGNKDNGVTGKLMLTQARNDLQVHISGLISGLTPGKHGFHVHQTGDISEGCKSTLGHFNPFSQPHAAPEDKNRHIGDLGNIEAGPDGQAVVDIKDFVISLYGPHSIIGRAIVVHEGSDDLGRVDNDGSKTTGNAGGRVACGIIGVVA